MAPTFCNRCGDAVVEGNDLRDELAELDALLERLTLKRLNLKRKINRFYSPIVRLLPPDVMSTIFEFCLQDFTDHELLPSDRFLPTWISPFMQLSPSEKIFTPPLSLGAICSYWRDIAWATPTLWSSLVVRDPGRHAPHIVTGIAQEWLARSGQLPLSIRISSTFHNESVSALFDIINQYSNRWSDLDFNIPDHCYELFHATDNHAPILRSIRFHSHEDIHMGAFASNLEIQLTCPRLERASFFDFPMDGTNMQWDNLTHLTLLSMSIYDSFLILRKTPRLVFCEFSGFYLNHSLEEHDIGAPVLTPLRSLQLLTNKDSDAEDVLNNLIAPHLEELSLPRYFTPSIGVITSFLRRSACSLRSLSMVFLDYSEGYMNLLRSLPLLNTLSIRSIQILANTSPDDYDPRNVFRLVAEIFSSQSTSLQQGFLPNLKILEYTGKLYYLRSGNYEDLYPLPPVNNAIHGPLQLLKLDLHYLTTRVPKKMMSYISSLGERGITVNVLSDSKDILQSSIDYYKRKEDFLSQDWTENFDSTLFP